MWWFLSQVAVQFLSSCQLYCYSCYCAPPLCLHTWFISWILSNLSVPAPVNFSLFDSTHARWSRTEWQRLDILVSFPLSFGTTSDIITWTINQLNLFIYAFWISKYIDLDTLNEKFLITHYYASYIISILVHVTLVDKPILAFCRKLMKCNTCLDNLLISWFRIILKRFISS